MRYQAIPPSRPTPNHTGVRGCRLTSHSCRLHFYVTVFIYCFYHGFGCSSSRCRRISNFGTFKPSGTPPFRQFSEKVAWKIGTGRKVAPGNLGKSRYSLPPLLFLFFSFFMIDPTINCIAQEKISSYLFTSYLSLRNGVFVPTFSFLFDRFTSL